MTRLGFQAEKHDQESTMIIRGSMTALRVLTVLAAVLVTSGLAHGQSDPGKHLEDFTFYARTANPDLAAAHAEALIRSGLRDAELAELLDETGKVSIEDFDDAVLRALAMRDHPFLEKFAAELATRIEKGRLDLARDADRIREAILMLIGNQRGRILGQNRLTRAGEYAVPQLLKEITDGSDERLKNQCYSVLVSIGRQAVTPLATALPELGDPVSQRVVCDILAAIGYPHSAPTLKSLMLDHDTPVTVREAAERAMRRVGGRDESLTTLYTRLGAQYFDESESLIAYQYEDYNNVWSYDPFIGLTLQPVPTEIFCEIMAMKNASMAINAEETNREALSLFVASNLKRENELPDGAVDPVFGDSDLSPSFYATLFGTETCMDVLGIALENVNTQLVRDAIRSLSQTTGGSNLFAGNRENQPLLVSLRYPDRRVQFESALTLARALPEEDFPGDFAVVPMLASAVRTGNTTYALVIAGDAENRRVSQNMLEGLDFEVVGAEGGVDQLHASIQQAIGIDLIVINQQDPGDAIRAVRELRLIPKAIAAPILIQTDAIDLPELRGEFRGDRRILVGTVGQDHLHFGNQVDLVLERAIGGRISESEAQIYAIEALSALRDIALARSTVYDIDDAQYALVEALQTRTGGARMLVADILALINSERAQQQLWDAALNALGSEQIDLLDRVAMSVKRFGDSASQHHRDELLDLIGDSGGETAEAAARVYGAMNSPSNVALELIPGVGG